MLLLEIDGEQSDTEGRVPIFPTDSFSLKYISLPHST